MSNHPVHLRDEDGKLSPTALIPFCDIGGNLSAMGVRIDHFDVPVCNSFKAKLVKDQLCYEVDPNDYIPKNRKDASHLDLVLIIDYNEDRQIDLNTKDDAPAGSKKI